MIAQKSRNVLLDNGLEFVVGNQCEYVFTSTVPEGK
jgi:hypothetical protein